MSVYTARWLMAIDAHPETIDTDLVVATALSNGDADVEGLDHDDVTDAVEMLIGYGFLEPVVEMGAEHILELRLP